MSESVFRFQELKNIVKRQKEGEFDNDPEINNLINGIKILVDQKYGPFITGVNGDSSGYPDTIYVCYHYGVNYGGIYKLVHHGRTGQ